MSGKPDWLSARWLKAKKGLSGATNEPRKSFKQRWSDFTQTVREKFPRNLEDLKKIRPEEALDRIRQFSSSRHYGTYLRLGAAAFAAYFLADTVSLFTASLIPEPPIVPAPAMTKKNEKFRSIDEYSAVLARNIFNSQGLIPEEGTDLASGPARKTNLPLNLIGTVVLADELKSIAAIEDRSQNLVFPVRIEDTIEDKIKVTKIEHLKVYFVNKSTGHLEYVEIVEDAPTLNMQPLRPTSSAPQKAEGITKTDETKFEVERNVIDRATTNLSEVLQQARAVPNFENGMPDGYKILQIVPNSIYDKLGLKNGDVICGLNGEPVNDPGKAFQTFNELKTSNHVEICIKRNGKKTVFNYDIR
ncbi:MAG: type II secretion system protein GspC [Bdellovibrionota bacterium]